MHWQILIVVGLHALSLPVLIGTVDRMNHVLLQTQFLDRINTRYTDNPLMTALHLLPGFLMLLIGPLQFATRLRRRYPRMHKALGWTFILSGTLSGIGVLWMVIAFPALGGLLTQGVTYILVSAICLFMILAVLAARKRQFVRHRAYMIRAYAIALSVSTARIFIESANFLFGLEFGQTFVAASAVGVAVNSLIAEWVISMLAKNKNPGAAGH